MSRFFFITLPLMLVLGVGCQTTPAPRALITDGDYVLTQVITTLPENEKDRSETECRLEVKGQSIVIWNTMTEDRALVGSLVGDKIMLTVYDNTPDPALRTPDTSIIYEGLVESRNVARGTIKGFEGSHKYVTGNWTLERTTKGKLSDGD